jgi:hypothetical protein
MKAERANVALNVTKYEIKWSSKMDSHVALKATALELYVSFQVVWPCTRANNSILISFFDGLQWSSQLLLTTLFEVGKLELGWTRKLRFLMV